MRVRMNWRQAVVCLTGVMVWSVAAASPLAAQAGDTTAVVRVAETLLRAISTKDTALARTTLLPGATFTAVLDPAPPAGPARVQTDVEFYRTLPEPNAPTFLERMWAPQVRFSGTSAAEVATAYDFHLNGKFSHCGTDVFTLVRSGGSWRVASSVYTVQMKGCAPSPLGPPTP